MEKHISLNGLTLYRAIFLIGCLVTTLHAFCHSILEIFSNVTVVPSGDELGACLDSYFSVCIPEMNV